MANLMKKLSTVAIFVNGIESVVRVSRFAAVSDILFADKLYQKFRNEDPPSSSDPAKTDSCMRQRIYENITNSGFFEWLVLEPVKIKLSKVYNELTQEQNLYTFNQLYTPTQPYFHRYKYHNPYTLRKIEVRDPETKHLYQTNEHVFVCLLRRRFTNDLVPFYISKEYNLSVNQRHAARFVFGEERFVILAERSGQAHKKRNFKIEQYYIRAKKNFNSQSPRANGKHDPVLKLLSKDSKRNQHFRLCAAVFSSSCFRTKFTYPFRVNSYSFFEGTISFRTPEAIHLADAEEFRENLVVCPVRRIATNQPMRVYISRAYKSNQVFVYLRDRSTDNLYLENVIVNVSIVREPEEDDSDSD